MKHKIEKLKSTDLTKRYPQVLLVGNGLVRNNGYSWHDFIAKCAKKAADINKYTKDGGFQIPNTILSMVLMDCNDKIRHDRYDDTLKQLTYQKKPLIDEIVNLPFDSILTTNYTYDIEYAIKSNYPSLSKKEKNNYAHAVKKDAKYLIHTYNEFKDYPPIWHIHGEARRKSSLISSHEEYARLINKIVEYSNNRKNDYEKYNNDVNMQSWVDYFILGDLYVLGFGFDYTEFDLWWLINRRMREKAKTGKIYFYEPKSDENYYKQRVMEDMGINVETLDMEIKNNDSSKYYDFYNKAIVDITGKVEAIVKGIETEEL